MKLQGKTTLITGGASGMGKASSKIFAKEGANLAIIDINEEAGQKTVSEIKSSGGKAVFFKADVSKH